MAGSTVHAETTSPLTSGEKDYLFGCALRRLDMFAIARERLKSEHFDPAVEAPYRVLWLAIDKIVTDYGEQVLFDNLSKAQLLLEMTCRTLVGDDKDPHHGKSVLAKEAQHLLFANSNTGLLHWIYECALPSDFETAVGVGILKRFFHERAQRQIVRQLQSNGGQVVSNLTQVVLHHLEQAADVVTDDPLGQTLPDDWLPEKLGIRPTGLGFLDVFMRGGWAPGEVYGILGCSGVGKTTLAVQIAISGAIEEREAEKAALKAGQPFQRRYWYIFHYEDGREDMRRRAVCFAATIDKKSLEDHDKISAPLSATDNPNSYKPYERVLWKDQLRPGGPGGFRAERERLAEARELLNNYVVMIDMSCPPGAPKRGTGFIQEVASIVKQGAQRDKPPAGVILDYAGVMARRYLDARSLDASSLRHLLGGLGDNCHRLIASPHQCSVWVMHQLNGEANKLSPHKPQVHTDSAEAKNFAENMWFAFTIGTQHSDSGCVLLARSKSRRAASEGRNCTLVKLNGNIGTFDGETGGWFYNGIIQKGSVTKEGEIVGHGHAVPQAQQTAAPPADPVDVADPAEVSDTPAPDTPAPGVPSPSTNGSVPPNKVSD